jgi:hypothetical protein
MRRLILAAIGAAEAIVVMTPMVASAATTYVLTATKAGGTTVAVGAKLTASLKSGTDSFGGKCRAAQLWLGTGGVSVRPRGRRVILEPSQTSGSYLRPATRSFIGISALSVILMFSGQTSVQHLVMLQ